MKRIVPSLLIFVFCFSCTEQNCFVEKGQKVKIEISVSDFDSLLISDQVEVILSYNENGNHELTLESYEGYLPSITHTQEGRTLSLGDNGICNWTKDFHRPKFRVSVPNLNFIHHTGFGKLETEGELPFENLHLFLEDCFAEVNLSLNSENLRLVSNSYTTLNLEGRSNNFNIFHAYNSGGLEARNFRCQKIVVNQRGNGRIHLFPITELAGSIRNTGNVYYYNIPDSMNISELDIGKFIDATENN
ncbi:GIN domain-containing protein [Sediminitomix flava]|uniref:Putative autotransporter adhesin-like protein n=1 Tax=Sediminitomix flava TaxID=379075 RepID=A0A315ZBS0_SEDFL|nr:DUF2807 domain-containing protein [Sediminitomix flava]PWJ42752.1 putative autotransporter adhesin-like protein [Sediminitomix flava]